MLSRKKAQNAQKGQISPVSVERVENDPTPECGGGRKNAMGFCAFAKGFRCARLAWYGFLIQIKAMRPLKPMNSRREFIPTEPTVTGLKSKIVEGYQS